MPIPIPLSLNISGTYTSAGYALSLIQNPTTNKVDSLTYNNQLYPNAVNYTIALGMANTYTFSYTPRNTGKVGVYFRISDNTGKVKDTNFTINSTDSFNIITTPTQPNIKIGDTGMINMSIITDGIPRTYTLSSNDDTLIFSKTKYMPKQPISIPMTVSKQYIVCFLPKNTMQPYIVTLQLSVQNSMNLIVSDTTRFNVTP